MLPGTVALVCAALWPTPNPATASITAAAWKGFICMTVCRRSVGRAVKGIEARVTRRAESAASPANGFTIPLTTLLGALRALT